MGLADMLEQNQNNGLRSAEEIRDTLHLLIADLKKINADIEVYVFGSVARGEATDFSDYDIAVVIPDNVDKKKFRSDFYAQRTKIKYPVDFIFRHKHEISSQSDANIINDVIKAEGVQIYPLWGLRD